jgi:hypothetical protein
METTHGWEKIMFHSVPLKQGILQYNPNRHQTYMRDLLVH